MQTAEIKELVQQKLPPRLLDSLYELAVRFKERGIRLFIFGSITRSEVRVGSDLDLGVLWENERSSKLFAELYCDIQDLPTIRKIDLVDMSQVDKDFRDSALQHALFLDKVI